MFFKICLIFKFLNVFKGFLFKCILSFVQSICIVNMIWDIKNVFKGENDLLNKVGKILDLIVGFKKEYLQDFNELFEILKDFI